jgi:hypothetical protein
MGGPSNAKITAGEAKAREFDAVEAHDGVHEREEKRCK